MNLLDLARSVLPGETVARPGDAPETTPTRASPAQEGEIRALLGVVAAGWPADERADALAAALADPDGALRSFRLLAAAHESRDAGTGRMDSRMRPCTACANLAPRGRCLAAARGELEGFSTTYEPAIPGRPLRCGRFRERAPATPAAPVNTFNPHGMHGAPPLGFNDLRHKDWT